MSETAPVTEVTEKAPHVPLFKEGDEFIVGRGSTSGQSGTVLAYDTESESYAVKLATGKVAVLSAKSLRPAPEAVISVAALVGAIVASLDEDSAAALAAEVETFYPGFAEKLVNAVE